MAKRGVFVLLQLLYPTCRFNHRGYGIRRKKDTFVIYSVGIEDYLLMGLLAICIGNIVSVVTFK